MSLDTDETLETQLPMYRAETTDGDGYVEGWFNT